MFYNKHVCQILRYDFDFMSHMSFMLLCRQFIKGVGGGPKMKKMCFSWKRVDINYITNYKINQNGG